MDGSEDYDMGYTPARGTVESISGLIHRPWDRPQNGRAAAVKTREERHVKDPFLQELAELMDKCNETQTGGCDACRRQYQCNKWWGGITNETNHGYMTQEMFKGHREEFLGRIKPR